MATFNLKVVTPSKVIFNDEVEKVIVRTVNGDVGILKGHTNYVAPLSIGAMKIVTNDTRKTAAIAGGMIKVDKNGATIITNACEWEDEIDVERAKKAMERAENYIKNPTELHTEEIAQIKLKRALNRINIANK